ncbi:MAG: hypothetical protein ACOYJC_00510 [Christensenellales bacterium]|jgi:hypothetical protein
MSVEILPIVEQQDEQIRIVGYEEREKIHREGLRHVTSLVLPVFAQNRRKVLTLDKFNKARKKAQLRGMPAPQRKPQIDVFGGHVTQQELRLKDRSEGILSGETMRRSALKELSEELFLVSDSKLYAYPVDASKLYELGWFAYEGCGNNELGFAFLYMLDGYPDNDRFMGADCVLSAESGVEEISLDTNIYTIMELLKKNRLENESVQSYEICDGLKRLLDEQDTLLPLLEKTLCIPIRLT